MRRLLKYETRKDPIASPQVFVSRLTRNGVWAIATVALSLLVGSWGYMHFENMTAIDAFANASMILSGMGPLTPLTTVGGKIFASLYAIASGFLLLGIASVMLLPVFHRLLHRFHVDDDGVPPERG
jgi:H+/Cl- antiporter ClcA